MSIIAPQHRVVLIRLTKSFPISDESSPEFRGQLYAATSKWWKIAASRTVQGPGAPEFAFAVHRGVVKAVYKIESWRRSPDSTRFGFSGISSSELDGIYGGLDVSQYFPNGATNPVRFVNCSSSAATAVTPDELVGAPQLSEVDRVELITELARKLDQEPLAHIMLGGRELFHTNLLAWFCREMPQQASDVFDALVPSPDSADPKPQGYIRRVERERGHLDLSIWWDDHRTPLVIENKVFSLPDPDQLDGYSARILNDTELDRPTQIILSLQDPQWPEDTFDTTDRVPGGASWVRVSYGRLSGLILHALEGVSASYEVEIIRHYAEMIKVLQELADAVTVRSDDEPVLLTDSLAGAHIEQRLLWSLAKLRARSVSQIIQSDLDAGSFDCTVDSGFSNGTPVITAFHYLQPNRAKGASVGWQLQGREFRLCAVLPGLAGASDADAQSRLEWGKSNCQYFDFGVVDPALNSAALQEYPKGDAASGAFNKFNPDFIYRSKKLDSLTVAQLLHAARLAARSKSKE
ncbi:MAG: PD-(D/E)XK nuclease family protein [Rhodococcus sp. (in: high G+C Gram-positive bacteria)]